MSSLFIADLHLKPNNTALNDLAISLFNGIARDYNHLFILGDFVEYWLGDDAIDPSLMAVFDALKALALTSTSVSLMLGNRDFLFGETFAQQYHLNLITDDEYLLEDEGQRIVLMHGDTLCTDDTAYQQLRTQLRKLAWQKDFLSKSIQERIQVANHLREASQKETG